MRVHFTKMQGAGNDFVVLDETQQRLGLSRAQYQRLADRHFGIGADQILSVRPAATSDVDFEYVIHNADGAEVEHCGNGARCFYHYVQERGLSTKDVLRVRTVNRLLTLGKNPQGRVAVDMGAPQFEPASLPFVSDGLEPLRQHLAQQWSLELSDGRKVLLAVASMGNPHAVCLVDDVDSAPVGTLGPLIGSHPRFPAGVNVGFMQIVNRQQVRLRVFERGAGETLACGTGACAAVAIGIRLGLLDMDVTVRATGGSLGVCWQGADHALHLSGPAVTVFSGDIEL